ncbi:MAG TPA: 1-(5-phosphoribosyl)-5-[(5-phosphoribosylamino)methylideneamino]imidazole-4-carboxamide isomerase [Gemmatimonadales bacterium]
MQLYPAIDIRHGRVVRLSQGEATRQTVYGEDPAAVAERFADEGADWVHVVDLDRALGEGDNEAAVRRLVERVGRRLRVQLGGGFRTLTRVRQGLDLGVSRVVIGTAAATDPAFVTAALGVAAPDRVAVGVDARDGRVAVRGWTETSAVRAEELVARVAKEGIETIIYTDVSRDGMLAGADLEGAAALQRSGARVIASGGVASVDDVRAARELGLAGVVIGRALYEGRLRLGQALEAARPEAGPG